jgi:hypothetical protein
MNGEWSLPQIPLHHKPNKKYFGNFIKKYSIKSLISLKREKDLDRKHTFINKDFVVT